MAKYIFFPANQGAVLRAAGETLKSRGYGVVDHPCASVTHLLLPVPCRLSDEAVADIVRLITPGVPDKKTVWAVTRSYYAPLVSGGVRIFEYAPGFCHGKMAVSDGCVASIGTSNLDYRSLYLHFENNVVLYRCDAVKQMEADFREMFPICREMTEEYRSVSLRICQCILRLFAPLM